jgi:hypothetical protein
MRNECIPWRHVGRMEIWLLSFIVSSLDKGEWSALPYSWSGCLEKRKFFPLSAIKPWFVHNRAYSTVTIEWAVSAPVSTSYTYFFFFIWFFFAQKYKTCHWTLKITSGRLICYFSLPLSGAVGHLSLVICVWHLRGSQCTRSFSLLY